MTVALITRFVPPAMDAIGEYVTQLAHALAAIAGVRVAILTSVGPVEIPAHSGVRSHPTISRWGWGGAIHLVRTLRRLQADVVNLQYVPQLYGRFGMNLGVAVWPLLIRLGTGRPVITTCHELLGHRPSTVVAWMLQLGYLVQAGLIVLGSSRVVVPAAWQERQLQRYFRWMARKIVRIPVGSSIPVVPPPAIPATGPTADGTVTLGTFGTGHPWWQYEQAMAIVQRLRARGLAVTLRCIGDVAGTNPAYYRSLRQLEARLDLVGAVEWTGRCSATEVSQHLRSLDLFLALQRNGVTARSTALMAALAHGLPIVATRGPDADEWLLQSGALRVISLDDLEQAAHVIGALVEDAGARQLLRQRAQEFYRRRCAWEVIARQWLGLIATLRVASRS